MKNESLVHHRLAVLLYAFDENGKVHFRRLPISNEEVAAGIGLTEDDVAHIGRVRKRIYLDLVDQQFCCEYEDNDWGQWKIYQRPRYWRGNPG